MEGFVKGLTSIVYGNANALRNGNEKRPESNQANWNQPVIAATTTMTGEDVLESDRVSEHHRQASSLEWAAEEVNPKQVIPMEDKDFKDF